MALRLRSRLKTRYQRLTHHTVPHRYFKWDKGQQRYVETDFSEEFTTWAGSPVIATITGKSGRIIVVTLNGDSIVLHTPQGEVRLLNTEDLNDYLMYLSKFFTSSMRGTCWIPHPFYVYLLEVLEYIRNDGRAI